MKFLRRMKKGFTIVELVIVIAVIAILTAILVPTFINISKKANKASDQSLKNYLNKALALVENDPELNKNGENKTMHYAVEDLEEYGVLVDKLTTKSDEKLVWNTSDNRFYFESEIKTDADRLECWKIQNSIETNQKFSVYAGRKFNAETVEVSGFGFDVGSQKGIKTINYVNSSTGQSTVSIRTNSANTTLNINAPKGTVNHYGEVGRVNITSIDMDCFNEHGKAAYIKLEEGKAVAKDGGEIAVVFAANNDGDAVAVIKEDGGEIEQAYTNIQPVSDTNEARENGIPMAYSIDGTTAATMDADELEAALVETETNTVEPAATSAVEVMAEEEVASDPNADKYVARIGATGYESFKEAALAAKEGETITIIKDFVIDSSIGNYNHVNALNNKVVINFDTTLIFKNSAQVYMTNKGSFALNGHTLTVVFDSSCDGTKYSGFMNCSLWTAYHGLHQEYWEYTFVNNNAAIFTDFYGDEDINYCGLVYTNQQYAIGGASGVDNCAYDEESANETLLNGEVQPGGGQWTAAVDEGQVARIYLASGATSYVWKTYVRGGTVYNESSSVIKVAEDHGSWAIVEGVKNTDGSLNGTAARVEVTVTMVNGDVYTYRWTFSVHGGNGGFMPGPGFDFDFDF